MPALHPQIKELMLTRLVNKCELMVRTIPPLGMTHQECLELVAPAEHVDLLIKAAEFASVKASDAWMRVKIPGTVDGEIDQRAYLSMLTHAERSPPLQPKYPQWQPGKSGHKIIEWLTKRYEIGRRFGTARYVLNYLDAECDNSAQLRYMFPSVLTLCQAEADPRMEKWIAKNAAYKPCKFAPAVPPYIKKAIQDASALLTSSVLIGEDVPLPDFGYVQCMPEEMPRFRVAKQGLVEIWAYRM